MGTLLRSTTGFFQRDHSIASAIDTPQAGDIFEDPRSPFWICRENVILRRHFGVAREPAFATAWIKLGRLKRVGRWIVSPLGECPSVRVRESLGILLDERDRFQSVRHVYKVRRLSVPFEGPLDLRNLGAVRKKLAVTGNAVPICVYHHVIRRDHFQAGFGLTYRNILPGFVSSEVRPREPVRYFQCVPVLRGKGQTAHDDGEYHTDGERQDVFAFQSVDCLNARHHQPPHLRPSTVTAPFKKTWLN